MNKFFFLISLIALFFLNNCSLDNQTGIWTGSEEERKKIARLEKGKLIKKTIVFSTVEKFEKEISPSHDTPLINPINNKSWPMQNLNLQNFYANQYYDGNLKLVFKKKFGKNKFAFHKSLSTPLVINDNVILSDDRGIIYYINKSGKLVWKKNFYTKKYKKNYKQLSYAFYKDNIYISDNIGFIYSIEFKSGKLNWKKFYGIPFNSRIKIFKEKIYLVDKDNKILCFNSFDGSKVWEQKTVSTFIKSQKYLALSISKNNHVFFINSAGDLFKIDSANGKVLWSLPTIKGFGEHDTDFFKSSDLVIDDDTLFFSNETSNSFSINSSSGFVNWRTEIKTSIIPIINGANIFLLTNNGYLVNLNKSDGKILWSVNVFKNIKKKKRNIKTSGFILGKNLIYITTTDGNLIIYNAQSGKMKLSKRISNSINLGPIISNNKIYILSRDQKLYVYN